MPMKVITICGEKEGEKAYDDWIAANPGIKIQTKHLCPKGPCVALFIFYETAESDEAMKTMVHALQSDEMDRLIELARQVSKDEGYAAKKNATQREMYLFQKYNIPRADAPYIIELLKPEMADVLGV